MVTVLPLIVGAALSLVLIRWARTRPPSGERRVYAVGLVVAALVYLIFGIAGGASTRWLALESLGVVIYGAAAWAGVRGQAWLLAVGWALHVGWDVALHLRGAGAVYTPTWYPWLCISFDLVIAVAVLMSMKRAIVNPGSAA